MRKEEKPQNPCEDCPYKFAAVENSCTMTANYPNCTWALYKKLAMGINPVEVKLNAKQCITRIKIYQNQKGGEENEQSRE